MVKVFSKSKFVLAAAALLCVGGILSLVGCSTAGDKIDSAGSGSLTVSASGSISVVSREDGSGTRGAFTEIVGIKNKSGEDMTTQSAVVTNSTAVMMTSVAGDEAAIGYMSLGLVDDSIKALKIDGAEATLDNVKNNSYTIARPFNIVTKDTISDAAQDFMNFIMSIDGQKIVSEEGYVSIDDAAEPYKASNAKGKVVVAGSSSVAPVMEKLAEAYQAVNSNVTVEVQQSDSSAGVQFTIDGVCDLGMASRDLKDSETSAGVSSTVIAKDGIAVIVNNNSPVDGLTTDQIRDIFTGAITDWADVQ